MLDGRLLVVLLVLAMTRSFLPPKALLANRQPKTSYSSSAVRTNLTVGTFGKNDIVHGLKADLACVNMRCDAQPFLFPGGSRRADVIVPPDPSRNHFCAKLI